MVNTDRILQTNHRTLFKEKGIRLVEYAPHMRTIAYQPMLNEHLAAIRDVMNDQHVLNLILQGQVPDSVYNPIQYFYVYLPYLIFCDYPGIGLYVCASLKPITYIDDDIFYPPMGNIHPSFRVCQQKDSLNQIATYFTSSFTSDYQWSGSCFDSWLGIFLHTFGYRGKYVGSAYRFRRWAQMSKSPERLMKRFRKRAHASSFMHFMSNCPREVQNWAYDTLPVYSIDRFVNNLENVGR